jgi:hypothetical protein
VIDLAEVSLRESRWMVCKSWVFRKPCADFDTVIVTSMNEGKFPAGKSQNSPYDVKQN